MQTGAKRLEQVGDEVDVVGASRRHGNDRASPDGLPDLRGIEELDHHGVVQNTHQHNGARHDGLRQVPDRVGTMLCQALRLAVRPVPHSDLVARTQEPASDGGAHESEPGDCDTLARFRHYRSLHPFQLAHAVALSAPPGHRPTVHPGRKLLRCRTDEPDRQTEHLTSHGRL